METILTLATSVNWGYNTKDQSLFVKSATDLYNYLHRNGANKLTQISDTSALQQIGKAFSYFARAVDNGYNANSVCAENAFYCLAKSVKLGNFYAAPELYNLVCQRSELLIDKLIYAHIRDIQINQPELSITRLWGFGNPTQNPDARADAERMVPYLRFYIISQFYDISKDETLMPSDIIEYSKSSVA